MPMMERWAGDEDAGVHLGAGITNRKLTTYDDLYETPAPRKAIDRRVNSTNATKRKSPEAVAKGEPEASVKRQRLDGLEQGDQASGLKELGLDGKQEVASSAQAEDSWQRGGGRLPAQIWQHVFTHLSPRQLSNLLLVNRLFFTLLHPSFQDPPKSSIPSILPALKPDAVWQISRRTFSPSMPAPLKGKSELDMWRIVFARSCQFCGSVGETTAHGHVIDAVDPWHRGPGAKGVSPVFPFGIVTCGPCLVKKSIKELDLILSSVPSALHPALPAAFLTSDLHIISPATLQRSSDLSTQEKPSRIYWPEHIEQVKTEFESVRSLGAPAAEEWLKGLDARGKKALVDASRWEKWELSGGRARLWAEIFPSSQLRTAAADPEITTCSAETSRSLPSQTQQACGTDAAQADLNTGEATRKDPLVDFADISSAAMAPKAPKTAIQAIPGLRIPTRPEHDIKDVASSVVAPITDAQAQSDHYTVQRRAEIERRAVALSPPIPPNVLAHMVSFKAALQIPSPLDEQSWDVLKPQLLAQRDDAMKKAREEDATALAVPAPASAALEEVPDELWDEAQGPLRARLVSYADEIIAKQWEDGERVSKKTSSRFAVEVLLHVRKRFYEDVEKDAAAARAAGRQPIIDPPQGPWTQKLTIENMKWIYDLKIRPLTEKHKKEPFFCNGCTQQKTFGLEGVIQHFAAKHYNALSRGSVVVFWRAEWPAVSPFSPDPTRPGVAAPPKSSAKGQAQQKQPTQVDLEKSRLQPTQPTHTDRPLPTAPSADLPSNLSHPPYHSSGSHEHSAGTHESSYHGKHPAVAAKKQLNPSQSTAPDHTQHQPRAKFMDRIAKNTWEVIAPASGAASIKAAILIHHVAKSFQTEYGEPAPLVMFMACLSRCQQLSGASALKKIQCKSCQGKSPGFRLDTLLQHFKATHLQSSSKKAKKSQKCDWLTEMVLLPHINELKKLPAMLKSSPAALKLAADAMPWAFDAPQGPASSRQHTQHNLPTRPPPAIAPNSGAAVGPSAPSKLGQAAPAQSGSREVPQAGFHITKTRQRPVQASNAPPHAPTGPAAMTKTGQAQALSIPGLQGSASKANVPPEVVDEDMDDAYSPPPPEAYQTKSPIQTVPQLDVKSQQSTSMAPPATKGSGRPSTYYHQGNVPILRPASEVYRSSNGRFNGTATGPSAPVRYDQGFDPSAERRGRESAHVSAAHRLRSVSPASGLIRGQPQYRMRSPVQRYYEQPPPPPAGTYVPTAPPEYRENVEYEVIRVRDPAGDYLLRRPIHQEVYGYDPRLSRPPPPPVPIEYHQPQYPDAYRKPSYAPFPPQRASSVAPYPAHGFQRASSTMAPPPPQVFGPPVVYEEYDPRDPGRLPAPPQQPHRYGTETRY
ncbi:hypothetical protein NLU13_9233 [Sarocladium strictum]|uniref:DUF7892 domain-containing protein n=1 Tax=Sarocladium strictum TaxID=5046 RepID=A0AA39G9R4_SARSR|nr:hypothetical protein NLU13_9233 [Sarocladium strictum]